MMVSRVDRINTILAQGLVAYSLTSGAQLWSAPVGTSYYASLHVAQLDADPALEIVLSGMPGTIVDGATRATEWAYKDGFAQLLEHGRFGGSLVALRLARLPAADVPVAALVADLGLQNIDAISATLPISMATMSTS